MSEHLERLDRRAFLRGMMVTSAGLIVPKQTTVIFTPPPISPFDLLLEYHPVLEGLMRGYLQLMAVYGKGVGIPDPTLAPGVVGGGR